MSAFSCWLHITLFNPVNTELIDDMSLYTLFAIPSNESNE